MNKNTNTDNSLLNAPAPGLRIAACYQPFRALDVLVGCEESQVVMKALREIGHNAKSCDLQECSGGEPEHHYQMDIFKAIDLQKWDLIILHPPCTAMAVSGNIGVLNKMGNFPKPNYIQPWQFGHGETKKTGFWLYGLEPLKPTDIVEGREQRIWKMPPSDDRGKLRSKTYPGIVKAIAEQWAGNGW